MNFPPGSGGYAQAPPPANLHCASGAKNLRRNFSSTVCATIAMEAPDETQPAQSSFIPVNTDSCCGQPINRTNAAARQPPAHGFDQRACDGWRLSGARCAVEYCGNQPGDRWGETSH